MERDCLCWGYIWGGGVVHCEGERGGEWERFGGGGTWDVCVFAVKEAVMGNGGCSARVRQTGFVRGGIDLSTLETLLSCVVLAIH